MPGKISSAATTPMWMGVPGMAARAPTAESRESPGKDGVTISPVSQKRMTASTT
jgi:hypothetical protein